MSNQPHHRALQHTTMRAYIPFAIFTLVAMVSSQSLPELDYVEPFQNPGEIIPNSGLTIRFLINAVGGIWQQERVIDSMAYACMDVLPVIGSLIPVVDQGSVNWGPICDEVIEASKDFDAFDARLLLTDMFGWINNMVIDPSGVINSRQRQQAMPDMSFQEFIDDPQNIYEVLYNATRDLYGVDINMIVDDISTINIFYTRIKEHVLRPSLQSAITKFGAEFMSTFLAQAGQVCSDRDAFIAAFNVKSSEPLYNIIQTAARIGSQAAGYDSIDDLCENLQLALSMHGDNGAAIRKFYAEVVSEILDIPKNADDCSAIAGGIINDVVEPIMRFDDPSYEISDDTIHIYTGIDGGVHGVCLAGENAFTNVIDLPDPTPLQLIPETTLTIEFLLNAAGGVWKQDRLIDSLGFVCTDVLPGLESMIPAFKTYVKTSWDYRADCMKIQEAMSNLEDFDSMAFCNDLKEMFTGLFSDDTGTRMRRQDDPSMQDPLDIISSLANVTKRLYKIDIYNPSTVCPNIAQFLRRSIPDIMSEWDVELMVIYLPYSASFCEGWDQMLNQLGIVHSSPYYPVIKNAARIASNICGYDSRQALCSEIDRVLAETDDKEAIRNFALETTESSYDILVNSDRCSKYGNGIIDNIIEPILQIENPLIKISGYTVYRYTGFFDVDGVCRAIETAFTNLFARTLAMKIKAQSINGKPVEYTNDLEDQESLRFKEQEELYCGVMKNYLNQELGSDLRGVDCEVESFSPDSNIADLELQLHAITEDDVDSLTQDAVELTTSQSITLSFSGDLLTLSEIQVTGKPGDEGGLTKGATAGIVIGVLIAVTLTLLIIIFSVKHFYGRRRTNSGGGGVAMENPGFCNDKNPICA